jgi:hypothetical protein
MICAGISAAGASKWKERSSDNGCHRLVLCCCVPEITVNDDERL